MAAVAVLAALVGRRPSRTRPVPDRFHRRRHTRRRPKPPGPRRTRRPPRGGPPGHGVRTVRPGQRVEAAPGVELWLTREGKHWALPGEPAQFRSVVDGNIDPSAPGSVSRPSPSGPATTASTCSPASGTAAGPRPGSRWSPPRAP
ncbi:hypothetical protein ACFQ60_20300 [Streptomyces zhihengii]